MENNCQAIRFFYLAKEISGDDKARKTKNSKIFQSFAGKNLFLP
jgi:hypothetical protein